MPTTLPGLAIPSRIAGNVLLLLRLLLLLLTPEEIIEELELCKPQVCKAQKAQNSDE